MSRFSPQGRVQNNSGDLIGQAISQALGAVAGGIQQKRSQTKADEDRSRAQAVQDIGLAREGIHLQKPGELPPLFDVNVSGGTSPDDAISRAINPQASTQASPLTASLSRHLTTGNGYYVDQDEQAQHAKQAADAHMASVIADALGKGRAEDMLNPSGRQVDNAYKQALTKQALAVAGKQETPPAPHIDPLSPQGLAAQRQLKAFEASLRPDPADKTPKPNDANLKAKAYLDISNNEDPALRDMASTVQSSALSRVPLIGNMLLKHTDPKYQSQQLAGDRWITQWLRATSGATITPDEMDLARRTYIPAAGDTPETLAAKASARQDVEKGLRTMAGPAAPSGSNAPTRKRLGGDTAGRTIQVNGKTFTVPE